MQTTTNVTLQTSTAVSSMCYLDRIPKTESPSAFEEETVTDDSDFEEEEGVSKLVAKKSRRYHLPATIFSSKDFDWSQFDAIDSRKRTLPKAAASQCIVHSDQQQISI